MSSTSKIVCDVREFRTRLVVSTHAGKHMGGRQMPENCSSQYSILLLMSSALYAKCPYYFVIYMQSVLIIECFRAAVYPRPVAFRPLAYILVFAKHSRFPCVSTLLDIEGEICVCRNCLLSGAVRASGCCDSACAYG